MGIHPDRPSERRGAPQRRTTMHDAYSAREHQQMAQSARRKKARARAFEVPTVDPMLVVSAVLSLIAAAILAFQTF